MPNNTPGRSSIGPTVLGPGAGRRRPPTVWRQAPRREPRCERYFPQGGTALPPGWNGLGLVLALAAGFFTLRPDEETTSARAGGPAEPRGVAVAREGRPFTAGGHAATAAGCRAFARGGTP